MSEWVVVCNNNLFDIKTAFEKETTLTWIQEMPVHVGECVYFYVGNPYRAILYKCEVLETELQRMDQKDTVYVLKRQFYQENEKYMRLKLISAYAEDRFTDEKLKETGVGNIQSSFKVGPQLSKVLHKDMEEKVKHKVNNKAPKFIGVATIVVLGIAVVFLLSGNSGKKHTINDQKETISTVKEKSGVENISITSGTNIDDLSEKNETNIEILADTSIVLKGDRIVPRVKQGSTIMMGQSKPLKWTIDNTEIATIDNGVIEARKEGMFELEVEYDGYVVRKEMSVVETDLESGVKIEADFDSVSLSGGEEGSIQLSFSGKLPENYGVAAYENAPLFLLLEWGNLENDTVQLNISGNYSAEEGDITILLYETDKPTHILATKKIRIKVK